MEVRHYFEILWRRGWLIVATAIVTVAIVALGTSMITPVYTASTVLRVPTATGGSPDYVDYDINYADRLLNTYAQIATSGPILEELASELNLDQPLQVDVEVMAGTELMEIQTESPDPAVARDAANALADLLISMEQSEQLRLVPTESTEQAASFNIVAPAILPDTPTRPRPALNAALALAVGLIGGTGLALFAENLDTRLHTMEMIEEATALPVLGEVPSGEWHPFKRTNGIFSRDSVHAEAFRHLSTNLAATTAINNGALHPELSEQPQPGRTLMVTSAEPKEGKSTVVANLAAAMARSGYHVIVVDADMRRPALHRVFNVPNDTGLSNLLAGDVALGASIKNSKIPGVQILPSGPEPPDAGRLMSSPRIRALIKKLQETYDLVLVDTPAYLPVADAALLAASGVADVLLVVGRAQARREAVEDVRRELSSVKARCLGVVVNRARREGTYAYYKH